jgi:hypothetical protein
LVSEGLVMRPYGPLRDRGTACGASTFTEHAVEIAEEGALRNPDVATLTGLALNLRGLLNRWPWSPNR